MGLIDRILFSDPTKALMKKDMQLLSKNHEVISSNIANASTPGYQAVHLSFEEKLRKATSDTSLKMTVTDGKHLSGGLDVAGVKPSVEIDRSSKGKIDGNTVDLDTEMGLMTQNQIMWSSLMTMEKQYGGIMKRALEDR